MIIPDFTNAPHGLLVTYSDHWYKEHCQKRPRTPRIGVMTDRKFFVNDGKLICWPEVFWEGEVMARIVHPINIKPYRKQWTSPFVRTTDDN